MSEYGIVPPTGATADWFQKFVLQQGEQGSLSAAGWTVGNEGFVQQTFLGASIRTFTINAGFGDSSSTMSVELVDDEYNTSDGVGYGDGDDAYHNGVNDLFRPPAVGSPVWFKFGKNFATVEQAWRRTFDELYEENTLNVKPFSQSRVPVDQVDLDGHKYVDLDKSTDSELFVVDKSPLWDKDTVWRGKDHLVFGGILQGYTENDSSSGRSLYTVSVTDPREVLSNCSVVLSNYQGTTFNNKNLFNVYGFLEYDPSQSLKQYFNTIGTPSILTKNIFPDGTVSYVGDDIYEFPAGPNGSSSIDAPGTNGKLPVYWPVTGQGFSRRSDQGIPFYRISQALTAMFEYNGIMPQEYTNAGFGGRINFRGFNYVVDFSGIPTEKIPPMYFMDFDQLDLLSFAQEICDVISHELFVQLLPIIDHPACEFLEKYNEKVAKAGRFGDIISGIIRLDAIDKSKQPRYGAILEYLQDLSDAGIDVVNKDIGFELSNVTTDKFVVGAQEVEMYFFHTNNDRDELQVNRGGAGQSAIDTMRSEQWLLETSLKQQVLPYYGLLGDKAVTIPKGWGSYQQILLDARNLNAFGVGNYYVATELELRAALVSYDRWKNFLLKYNETYIQDIAEYGATYSALGKIGLDMDVALQELIEKSDIEKFPLLKEQLENQFTGREFAVTVPRSVWDSDRPYMGYDGLPASPCSPPFGYPLYYKRATKIGIPEGGVVKIINAKSKAISNYAQINEKLDSKAGFANASYQQATDKINLIQEKAKIIEENTRASYPTDKEYWDSLRNNVSYQNLMTQLLIQARLVEDLTQVQNDLAANGRQLLARTKNTLEGLAEEPMIAQLPQIAKAHLENAKKVYQFVKKVAEENLGKKFLVKIPKACNVRYQPRIKTYRSRGANIAAGPFGFQPLPVDNNFRSFQFLSEVGSVKPPIDDDWYNHYTNVDIVLANGRPASLGTQTNYDGAYRNGALRCNYNPINDQWNYNYKPEPQGGYFNYSIFQTNVSPSETSSVKKGAMPVAGMESLCPLDIKNFISQNGRVQCYVKYDNSHVLNFANVPANQIAQQTIDAANNSWTPDIVQSLPNVRADQLSLFRFDTLQEELDKNAKNIKQAPSVAFVKCEVDERLFMPPKMVQKDVEIFGRKYIAMLSNLDVDVVETADSDGCPEYETKVNNLDPVFSLPQDGGVDGTEASYIGFFRDGIPFYSDPTYTEYIINTNIQNLDSNHVYALVTVPGRVQSTIDQRYADGPMQANNTVTMKQLMTQDVVKIPEFNVPNFPEKEPYTVNCETVEDFNPSLKELGEVDRIQRQATKGIKFNQGEVGLEFIQPSPIYPSMFAIPLMSWERCYGPWLSSAKLDDTRIRYNNLGGKMEFVKDERLAPWNYGGYQLLNEAGLLQAQFSNSLMTINERGGFVVPDIPTGISLAGALKQSGPLVTSISANITDRQLQTTVKLDLYTASYGKLQKQKEGAIAQVVRERQKMVDQTNNAIRRGMGKSQTAIDPLGQIMANGGQKILDIANGGNLFLENAQKEPRQRIMIANQREKSEIAYERQMMQGVESNNTKSQMMQDLGATPSIAPLGDGQQVVQTHATYSRDVPTPDYFGTGQSKNSRLYNNANEGEV